MKRHNNLFEKILDSNNLIKAYKEASKSKRKKPAYKKFTEDLYFNIKNIHDELSNDTYANSGYTEFMIASPKPRIIQAPKFKDVVVQHAVYQIINELFDRRFVDDSYACRINKGTHKASLAVLNMVRSVPEDSYILKLDYRKFFYSINHDDLRREISKIIKCKRTLNLMFKFFGNSDVGIPIGSLLSQLYANIYLNPVDHFVKRTLKVKNYCRYMDDLVLIGLTKEEAIQYKKEIENFSRENLHLEFSKTSITKVKNGTNFVGYRTWRWGRLIRKRSMKNFYKFCKMNDNARITTILGHAKNTISYNYMTKFLESRKNE